MMATATRPGPPEGSREVADADDLRDQLRRLLSDNGSDTVARLIADARAQAEARVRLLLTEAYTEVLLEQVSRAGMPEPPSATPIVPAEKAAPAVPEKEPIPAVSAEESTPPPSGDRGWYVYCVIGPDHDPVPVDLAGVDPRHPVTTLEQGELAAVVSRVPLSEFGEEPLREHLSDMEWLERTARGHEQVQEEVARGGTPIPMRLCTIFRDDRGVRDMLTREGVALGEALDHLRGKAEWGVKGFADIDAVAATDIDRAVSGSTEGSGDGAAYMQSRLHQRRRREDAAARIDAACESLHTALCALAADGVTLAPHRPEITGRQTPMIFNASYLVVGADADAFHRELDRLTAELAELGIELERTGPWPPYNFVPGAIGAAW